MEVDWEMEKKKIVILEPLGVPQERLLEMMREKVGDRVELIACADRAEDVPALIERSRDADAVVLSNFPYRREVIEHCPSLKLICVAFTVIGTRKGKTAEESIRCNFGMPSPEGYRKALRLMKQAEKFRRPVITLIDTSGAYPGLEAEARGQGEAIARNLLEMSRLTVPVIAVITGEGNSGGALALGVANRVLMLENAVYAILSPEGFASILWRDASRHEEACGLMKLTAPDLLALGVTDGVIPEPAGGAHCNPVQAIREVDRALEYHLSALLKESGQNLAAGRYKKFRKLGVPGKVEP